MAPGETPTREATSPAEAHAAAPDVEIETFDGEMHTLADLYAETPLVVNFWA